MTWLDNLERDYGRYIPAHLTYFLLGGQLFTYLLVYANPSLVSLFALRGDWVLDGDWWRLVTFLFMPFADSPLFLIFVWFMYYTFGTTLEYEWGDFRYFIYLLLMWMATVVAAFFFPEQVFANWYIYGSLFLAFAYLYPDYMMYIFFVIPVKVKWLSWLIWFGIGSSVIWGTTSERILALISISNFLLFFGKDFVGTLFSVRRQVRTTVEQIAEGVTTYMKCEICGVSSGKIFYYCDTCVPETCYCEDHIKKHSHVGA